MSEKQTTVTNQQQKYTPTAEETEANRLQLELMRNAQPGQMQAQTNSLNLINQLLTGQNLPGYLNTLPGGISPEVTQSIVNQSLADIRPGLQAQGLFDSGTRAALEARTASDIRTNSAQFNLQNLSQLLNLAVGGQAQVQAPINQNTGMLNSQLAGLRSMNSSSSSTVTSMNPFLKSFQQSAGQSFGKAAGVATGNFIF